MKGIIAVLLFVLMATSASAFVVLEGWSFDEVTFTDYPLENRVSLDTDDLGTDDDIRVVFTIPELDIRASRGPFNPRGRSARVMRELWIPEDAEAGEYVVRMTVTDSSGNRRVRHRFVQIE